MTKKDDEEFSLAPRHTDTRVGAKKQVEVWAAEKGMYPQFLPVPAPQKGQIPEAPRTNPKYGEFAAAQAGSRWPQGAEVTEAEFDAAVEKFYGPNNVMR
jgi:hypothetical protein